MRIRRSLAALALCAAAASTAGCASEHDLALMRQPPLPPLDVLKADQGRQFYHNVFLQEVSGAPEFRWLDGGALLTTRPTRLQAIRMLNVMLARADMDAPRALDADYLLRVRFNDLRGPDMAPGSEKLASASVTFQLFSRRSGQLMLEKTVEASYRARWIGVTPEEVRAFIAGPIGVTKDSAIAPVGGLVGGAVLGYYLNDRLVLQIAETPLGGLIGAGQAGETGGPDAELPGFWTSFATSLALSTARGHYSDVEAALAGGLISGVGAATSPVVASRVYESEAVMGFDGTARRAAATHGLIHAAFEDFMSQLLPGGAVVVKKAVSCAHLNPDGRRFSYVAETATEYALDCPGARYNAHWTSSPPE